MIKLKDILKEISQEEWVRWRISDEYKEWRKDWLKRYRATFDDKGRIVAYHGTTSQKAKLIKQNGFNNSSNFTLRPEYAKHWGRTILTVHLPVDAVDFVASDIISIRPIKWEEVI